MSLFSELKRRNVLRVAIAYLAVAWLLVQVVETLFPIFGLSDASIRLVVILLAIGFPLVLIFSWVYELTPAGLMLERDVDRSASVTHHTGKQLDRVIIVVLALAVGYFAFDKFILDPAQDRRLAEQSRQEGVEQAREEALLAMWNEKSVAVLPFTNHSMQPEDESFTNGMHDELLTRLAGISALKVISRTSVMRYRDSTKSLPEIAKELSVAAVVEGGVQRLGNQVRVNVQLIDARSDEHRWGEIYDRELTAENLFAIQSEISSAIAKELDAELSPAEEARAFELPTANLEAYSNFMRGKALMATDQVDNLKKALQAFERAVEIDPEFALAWVGIANANRFLRTSGDDYSPESLHKRKQAIDRALALDGELGEAWLALSRFYFETGEHQKSEAACRKAIELSPNNPRAYLRCAGSLGAYGPAGEEQRLAWLYKAGQLDPLSVNIQNAIGHRLENLGRYDDALEQYTHLLQLDPDHARAYSSMCHLRATNGDLAEAIRWCREALRRNPADGWYMRDLAHLYLNLGDFESVERIRQEMHTHLDDDDWRFPALDFTTALVKGNLDDMPAAMDRYPESVTEDWWVQNIRFNMYFYLGEPEKARDYAVVSEPAWADPDQWEHLIADDHASLDRVHACKFASILIGLGEEKKGKDLLRQATHFSEVLLPGYIKDSDRSPSLGWCYLAAGSYDKALDFYEQRVAHGHIADWWREKYLPWWAPLREDDRYIALVNEIDRKLAEQLALLRQMDEADTREQVL